MRRRRAPPTRPAAAGCGHDADGNAAEQQRHQRQNDSVVPLFLLQGMQIEAGHSALHPRSRGDELSETCLAAPETHARRGLHITLAVPNPLAGTGSRPRAPERTAIDQEIPAVARNRHFGVHAADRPVREPDVRIVAATDCQCPKGQAISLCFPNVSLPTRASAHVRSNVPTGIPKSKQQAPAGHRLISSDYGGCWTRAEGGPCHGNAYPRWYPSVEMSLDCAKITTHCFSHIGQRGENQDRSAVLKSPDDGSHLIVVADGLGGIRGARWPRKLSWPRRNGSGTAVARDPPKPNSHRRGS